MARLEATIGWRLTGTNGGPLDGRVVDLVDGAARTGSLAAAARSLAIPYRTAWALVDQAERRIGGRLLELERGVGARPTALGRRLLGARERAALVIAAQAGALDVGLAAARSRAGAPLRVAASHDLVLGELRDLWARRHRIALEFHGSVEALDLYRAGRADVAGFHVAKAGSDSKVAKVGSDSTFANAKVESDPFATALSTPLSPRGSTPRATR
ncbi:MAG: LysR family transcriptional regulator [Burkholderiales bacterium]